MRQLIGQESKGRIFRDRFLIADVKMKHRLRRPSAGSGSTRRSIRNQSVLLHTQPDGVWRIDFQLGWDADPGRREEAREHHPAREGAARAFAGDEGCQFELEWASVYTFACLRMDRLPPRPRAVRRRLGARRVAVRRARRQLGRAGRREPGLEARRGAAAAKRLTRCSTATPTEREYAADENIRNSTRSTDFITPKSEISRAVPRRGARAGEAPAVRAHAGQQRPAVGAGDAARLAAEHARRRTPSRAAWCPARRPPTRRSTRPTAAAAGCCASSAAGFTALVVSATKATRLARSLQGAEARGPR